MKLKLTVPLVLAALACAAVSQATSPTFGVQYELSGTWIDTGGGAQSFTAHVVGAMSDSKSYSESLPYQFVCYFKSDDSLDEPLGSGSATVNMTEYASAGALIIGSTGSSHGHGVCSGQTADAMKSSGGSQVTTSGPAAISGLSADGSDLIWFYDTPNNQWIGYWPLVTESMTGSATYTAANGGDSRDQASAGSTVAAGSPSLISSNTIVVIQ